MRSLPLLTVLAALVLWAAPLALGQSKRVVIDVETKSQKGLYPIAVPRPADSDPELAELVTDVMSFDLAVSSWFKVLDPRSFLADLQKEGLSIEPQRWKDVGAFGVIKTRAERSGDRIRLTFRLYEIEKGAIAVLERQYSGRMGDARRFVHAWANEVVEYYTGEPGFFGSQITFVTESGRSKQVALMDFDGHGVRTLTRNSSINVLPAFSRSGGEIAFTSYMRRNPDLYVKKLPDARPRRISRHPGMNTGAAYSPDGRTIALTLSRDGDPELYLIDSSSGKILRRLTNNRYIDTSPSFSPDGREIAFVSNREGSPQIFVMNIDGSNVRRISTSGTYNQTPAFCPMKGKRLVAWTARDDVSGRYDIITKDLETGQMTRVTQNQGSNEEPTWSPNCRVIAFASRLRKEGPGIYLANADGTGEQHIVYKGRASSPDWGPMPAR